MSTAALLAAIDDKTTDEVLARLASSLSVDDACASPADAPMQPGDHDRVRNDTPLIRAARRGQASAVRVLLAAGAAVDRAIKGKTPLHIAASWGHAEVVSLLLATGAAVDQAAADNGWTPLLIAARQGHAEVASLLLAAGAAAHEAVGNGATPLSVAIASGQLGCVRLLSSHGAPRKFTIHGTARTAEAYATAQMQPAIAAWLASSRGWTALHHLDTLTAGRARALLRGGAGPLVRRVADGPTPLDVARTPAHRDGEAAALVRRAAEPWSPATHALWPEAARACAVTLARLGFQLSRQARFGNEGQGVMDCWRHGVMPAALRRRSGGRV